LLPCEKRAVTIYSNVEQQENLDEEGLLYLVCLDDGGIIGILGVGFVWIWLVMNGWIIF